jgi:putative hydrolase of the HAD superfamily
MNAVIFELFDTLVTDSGNPRYTLRDSANALDMDYSSFLHEWEKIQQDRYTGKINSTLQAYKTILKNLNIKREEKILVESAKLRDEYKSSCFTKINPAVLTLLSDLRKHNFKIGVIANCALEEASGLPDSDLDRYLDAIVLSCDIALLKPDMKIYEYCLALLNEKASRCFYISTDIINNDLLAANISGMKSLKALWYVKNYRSEYAAGRAFPSFSKVEDVMPYILENN